MVELVQFPRRLAVSEAPQSTVTTTQVESPYKAMGLALDKLGEGLSEAAVPIAEQAGYKAVTRDADGNIQVERAPIIGKAAIAYQRAVKVGAVVEADRESRLKNVEMREAYKNDPDGYLKAAEAYREKLSDEYERAAGPEVGLTVGKHIDHFTVETYQGLKNEKERLDLRTAEARINSGILRAANELDALAAGGAEGSEQYKRLMSEVVSLNREKLNNPKFAYPKEQFEYETQQLDSKLKVSAGMYHLNEIYKRDGYEAAVKAADMIRTDPKLNLTAEQRFTLYNRALSEFKVRRTEQRISEREDKADLAEVSDNAAKGYPPTAARMGELRSKADVNPAFAEQLRVAEGTLTWIQDARKKAPADLEADLVAMEKEMRENGITPAVADRYTAGRTLQKNMVKEITTNPLGWADRTGVTAVPAIDFTAPDAGAQMRARIGKAEGVGEYYRQAPTYLRPEEKAALETAAAAGGPQMLKVAQIISQGFGDKAPKVLAEISPTAPVLAHLGGLLAAGYNGGRGSVIADAAENVKLRQDKDFKMPKFDTAKAVIAQENVEQTTYGDAFTLAPDTGRAAQAVARDAFTTRMLRGTDKVDDALALGSKASTKAYERALQESAGARFPNGVQYGGVAPYGTWYPFAGRKTVIVPPMVKADSFKDVIGAVKDTDIPGVRLSDVQNATPVATRGGYLFALGNPTSEDPKWVPGPDGRPFVLDYPRLEPELRKRVPTAFLGGR